MQYRPLYVINNHNSVGWAYLLCLLCYRLCCQLDFNSNRCNFQHFAHHKQFKRFFQTSTRSLWWNASLHFATKVLFITQLQKPSRSMDQVGRIQMFFVIWDAEVWFHISHSSSFETWRFAEFSACFGFFPAVQYIFQSAKFLFATGIRTRDER